MEFYPFYTQVLIQKPDSLIDCRKLAILKSSGWQTTPQPPNSLAAFRISRHSRHVEAVASQDQVQVVLAAGTESATGIKKTGLLEKLLVFFCFLLFHLVNH